MNTIIITFKQLKQLSHHLTGPGLVPPKGSFLVQREAPLSSHKRTCQVFYSSSSLNSHWQHQKDPEKKLVELGKPSIQLLQSGNSKKYNVNSVSLNSVNLKLNWFRWGNSKRCPTMLVSKKVQNNNNNNKN